MSYGTDFGETFQQAASLVDRILRGAKPIDLPVQTPTKYQTSLNLKTAKALGLTVPPGLLVAADEVIEYANNRHFICCICSRPGVAHKRPAYLGRVGPLTGALRKSRVGLDCRDRPLRTSRGHPPARSRVRAIGDRKFGRHRKATPLRSRLSSFQDGAHLRAPSMRPTSSFLPFGDVQPGAVGGGKCRFVLRPRRRLQQQREIFR